MYPVSHKQTKDKLNALHPVNPALDDAEESPNQNVLVNSSYLTLGPNSKPVENCFGKQSRSGFGDIPRETKFGNNARRTLLRVGAVLDGLMDGPSEAVFLTGTIPNGYDDGRITASAYSGWFVHSLKAWVNKYASSKHDFYVWEYQRRGSLHLHYCVWVQCPIARRKVIERFHEEWVRLLLRITVATGVDLCYSSPNGTSKDNTAYIQAYAQEVRLSVAKYLSKYCGKEAASMARDKQRNLYPPSRWWGASRPLLQELKRRTCETNLVTIGMRDAYRVYDDVSAVLYNTSEEAYNWEDKSGRSRVTVAYQTAKIGKEQCQILMNNPSHQTESQGNLPKSELMTTSLRAIHKRAGLTQEAFYNHYTPYSATLVSKLQACESLTIIEYMELANGTLYLLWSRYRNRNGKPSWYPRAEAKINNHLTWVMNERDIKRISSMMPLTDLD